MTEGQTTFNFTRVFGQTDFGLELIANRCVAWYKPPHIKALWSLDLGLPNRSL